MVVTRTGRTYRADQTHFVALFDNSTGGELTVLYPWGTS